MRASVSLEAAYLIGPTCWSNCIMWWAHARATRVLILFSTKGGYGREYVSERYSRYISLQ